MDALAARSTRAGRLASNTSARRFWATTCFRRCAFLARFSAMFGAMADSSDDSELLHDTGQDSLGGVAAHQIFWGQAPIEIAGRPLRPASFAMTSTFRAWCHERFSRSLVQDVRCGIAGGLW